jgi:hypothetical protein
MPLFITCAIESMKITYLAALSLLLATQAVSAHDVACSKAQLEIRQIASDTPGMSKSNAFFAILNKGERPCRLTAQLVGVSDGPPVGAFNDNAPIDFVLSPLHENDYSRADDLIGFNVSNDSASGPTRHITKLHFRLADGKTFDAEYTGYDTSPFAPRAQIIPFFAWPIFQGDQCVMKKNKRLSFVENPKIDMRAPLLCG